MTLRILVIGEESAGIQLLRSISDSEHQVVGVLAKEPTDPSGASVWTVARSLGYRMWPAESVKDPKFAEVVRGEAVDLILNVHSLYIVAREILEAPRIGSFNLHPGPLPRYAGLNTPSWALYRGETTYGVTLHHMVPKIDAGPIVYQSLFPIEAQDTALSLYLKCIRAGLPLLTRLLESASQDPGSVPTMPQDLSLREYFGAEIPQNGRLIWSRPATEVINFVRACDYSPFESPWGHPRAGMADQEIEVLKASTTRIPADAKPGTTGTVENGHIHVACGDEWILVEKIALEGRIASAADVLSSAEVLQNGC